MGVNHETLRNWVDRMRQERDGGHPSDLAADERAELIRLRRQVAQLELEKEIRKRAGFLREGDPVNMYPFTEAEQAGQRTVKRACELLQVSRSAYYVRNQRSTRERVDEQLTIKIREVHAASKGTYGAPRIHAELAEAGLRHGRRRITRRMRGAGIQGKSPRRWQGTTIADPNAGTRPDLIGRDFTVDPAAIDSRWCGDITYINTWEGWLYLAIVIDLA